VKRVPQAESRFPVLFGDRAEAEQYAARHARLARKMADRFIRRLRERAGVAARVSFVEGDVQSMPLEDDSFDAVVSVGTLHVVDDPVAMLDECARVLTPDGTLLAADVRRSCLGWLDPIFRTGYTADEVRRLVARSALRPCRVRAGLMFLHLEGHAPA